MTCPIQQGDVVPIRAIALEISEATGEQEPVTGLTDLLVWIYRESDGLTFDWDDSTFKAFAACTTPRQQMLEKDATNYAGQYYRNWITPAADDIYQITVDQDPGTDVDNVPQAGEIVVGGWVDDIDDAISSRSSPGDAMSLVANAVDATAIATSGAQEIRDQILADSTSFNGADIASVLADTSAIDSRLPADPADESNLQAQHTATQAAIAALNDIDQAGVQSALTAQGYTTARASNLDNLDAAISAVLAAVAALNDIDQAGVQTALTAQGYTIARAAMIELSKKVLINRLTLADGDTGNMILYDDDGVTPLLTFSVTDHLGNPIALSNGEPARRGAGS